MRDLSPRQATRLCLHQDDRILGMKLRVSVKPGKILPGLSFPNCVTALVSKCQGEVPKDPVLA